MCLTMGKVNRVSIKYVITPDIKKNKTPQKNNGSLVVKKKSTMLFLFQINKTTIIDAKMMSIKLVSIVPLSPLPSKPATHQLNLEAQAVVVWLDEFALLELGNGLVEHGRFHLYRLL